MRLFVSLTSMVDKHLCPLVCAANVSKQLHTAFTVHCLCAPRARDVELDSATVLFTWSPSAW